MIRDSIGLKPSMRSIRRMTGIRIIRWKIRMEPIQTEAPEETGIPPLSLSGGFGNISMETILTTEIIRPNIMV